ncbi:MAG: uridine kinase [Candidatus Marinimicrobia bacterium]|jgi:uridine kinase|nr:uridine kinase [Candidatus Neomarinimicrobiota bacterium]MBT3633900.1 uridine kinase [Candidatus Neomarinimicrobiota bacterium]MBT3682850.1 uridine kinase [Candidatus Neomarinimicrobiota bacterium]MBT3759963.1 uridine kinase [Candidatus Neomarinimicrobiota bacterium]MBT3896057.1 uridine kinase [Candidatus Neomarinimicrobiota bacterium]
MKKSILIGIAGGTGSGKTTVAKALSAQFGKSEVALLEQDSYYKDLVHLPFSDREKVNFDHPDAVDFEEMKIQLKSLLNGSPIDVPIYDYSTHTRSGESRKIGRHHIIILDGILVLLDPELRDMMDIKLYVETADDIRIIRRIKRDMKKRGRTFESIIHQYYTTVRPSHRQFVEPTKMYADIIIPEGGRNTVAIDLIRTKILSVLLGYKIGDKT